MKPTITLSALMLSIALSSEAVIAQITLNSFTVPLGPREYVLKQIREFHREAPFDIQQSSQNKAQPRDPELYYKNRILISNLTAHDLRFALDYSPYHLPKGRDLTTDEMTAPIKFVLVTGEKLVEYVLHPGKQYRIFWNNGYRSYDLLEMEFD
ncbi:hypothetical protein [Dyadobacter bucti]|uniref:hypothetical protein n=1 Tax=Dyadobacter bucti TaxID=2572203 RepID=UPI001109651B|nr:hypothetical protein [Dyadobacter bucti]